MSSGILDDGVLGYRRALGDMINNYGKRPSPPGPSMIVAGNKIGRFEVTAEKEVKQSTLERCSIKAKENICRVPGIFEHVDDHKGNDLSLNFQLAWGVKEAEEAKCSCMSSGLMTDCHSEGDDRLPELEEDLQDDSDADSLEFMTCGSQTGRGNTNCLDLNRRIVIGLKENNCKEDKGLAKDLPGISVACSQPSGSPTSKMDRLGGLVNLHAPFNGDPVATVGNSTGLDKACSCSFCLKAAYMWMDLQYQDTRGRLSALTKSRRYARSLEGRCYDHDHSARFAQDNSRKYTKLEHDLMQYWRLLFRHTEDVLVHESAQNHSCLLRIKELRGNCKRDLEMIGMVSTDKS